MPESQRIQDIRDTIRAWMNDAIADEDTRLGKELQDNIRKQWAEIFTDQPNRPIANRDAVTMAVAYLQEAAWFARAYDSERIDRMHAQIAETDLDTIQRLRDTTGKADEHIRTLASSLCRLASNEELSFADMQHHLSHVKKAASTLRDAEKAVAGTHDITQTLDGLPGRRTLIDALDKAIESFNSYKIGALIEGRSRGNN